VSLAAYRNSPVEQERVADLMRLVPADARTVLDVGARDGYLSRRLAERCERVIALDLDPPDVAHPRVECMGGDITALDVPDRFVDGVLCAEVLEHIPGEKLPRACAEIRRIAGRAIVIGVPYRQDLRLGRTVCTACGRANPPWGHVNSFSERRLAALFPGWQATSWSFVGRSRERTNWLSARLMDFAGNPYGTYAQEERCVHCDAALGAPAPRTFLQKVATRTGATLTSVQQRAAGTRPRWIHVLFTRP
jgi:SAM-dependent methyltransferase